MARVRLTALLSAAMAASTVMQFALGALGPHLIRDLELSRTGLGALSATYYLAAALLSPPLGRGVDALSSRTALAAIFAGGGTAILVVAVAPSLPVLLLGLVAAGAVAALGNPATNRVLARLEGPRGAATGVKQAGVQVGALASGVVLPAIAAAADWRVALACVSAACFAGVALLGWLPAGHGRGDAAPRALAAAPVSGLRRLGAYAFLMGLGVAAATTFLPLYGVDRLDLDPVAAGMLVAVVGIGGIVSRVSWSAAAERRAAGAGAAAGPLPWLSAGATCSALLVLAAPAAGPWLLWAGAAGLGLTAVAWNAVVALALIERAPADVAGRTAGRVLIAFYLGLCASGPLFGTVVDGAGYAAGWAIVAGTFAVAALTARGLGEM